MRPLRRIYYIPGILTLAIAPILFVAKTNKYLADRAEHCIKIIVGSEEKMDGDWLLPKRDYQVYRLNGLLNHDSLTLILVENFSRGLNLSKNDSIGLKVILDKNIKYKTYIDLLNSCLKSGISNWIPLADTVFIYYKTRPNDYNSDLGQNYLMSDIGLGSDCCFDDPKPEPTMIQKIKNHEFEIKLSIPFVILYLILVYLTIVKIKNEG